MTLFLAKYESPKTFSKAKKVAVAERKSKVVPANNNATPPQNFVFLDALATKLDELPTPAQMSVLQRAGVIVGIKRKLAGQIIGDLKNAGWKLPAKWNWLKAEQ